MSIWADLEHRDRRTRQGIQEPYCHAEVTATDVAESIAFVLSWPR